MPRSKLSFRLIRSKQVVFYDSFFTLFSLVHIDTTSNPLHLLERINILIEAEGAVIRSREVMLCLADASTLDFFPF